MSIWSKLGKIALAAAPIAAAPFTGGGSLALLPTVLSAGGAVASAMSGSAAANRDAKATASLAQQKEQDQQQRDFQDQMIARETSDRAGQSDAWKKLQQASYVAGGGANQAPTMTTSGRALAPTSFSPKAAGADEVAAATALQGQTRDDLMAGRFHTNGGAPTPLTAPKPFVFDPKLLDPSIWEKLGGIAGPALGAIGGMMGQKSNPSDMSWTLPGQRLM